jgi:hypothetical protein
MFHAAKILHETGVTKFLGYTTKTYDRKLVKMPNN